MAIHPSSAPITPSSLRSHGATNALPTLTTLCRAKDASKLPLSHKMSSGLMAPFCLADSGRRQNASSSAQSSVCCAKPRRLMSSNLQASRPTRRHCRSCSFDVSGPTLFDSLPWIAQLEQSAENVNPWDIADLSQLDIDCSRGTTSVTTSNNGNDTTTNGNKQRSSVVGPIRSRGGGRHHRKSSSSSLSLSRPGPLLATASENDPFLLFSNGTKRKKKPGKWDLVANPAVASGCRASEDSYPSSVSSLPVPPFAAGTAAAAVSLPRTPLARLSARSAVRFFNLMPVFEHGDSHTDQSRPA